MTALTHPIAAAPQTSSAAVASTAHARLAHPDSWPVTPSWLERSAGWRASRVATGAVALWLLVLWALQSQVGLWG